jgi:ornithine cyclodeaminase
LLLERDGAVMRLVDAETVHRLLDYAGLVGALRAAHRGPRPVTDRFLLEEPPHGANKFLALGAWAPGEAIATKLVGVFPANLGRSPPEPSVQGIVALFDGTTGAARLVADGAAMTERKTLADSALGADLLARPDAATLLVVGAGALAPHAIRAHRTVRPSLDRVLVWNRTQARAAALVADMAREGIEVTVAADLDAAVAAADVICCVTMSAAPLVRGALLKPGAHVDLIGGYTPRMREADDDTVRRGRVFMDNLAGLDHAGDLIDPIRRSVIAAADVLGDLWQLCAGSIEGRRSADEITVYKNIGGAHLDLFTARWLATRLA